MPAESPTAERLAALTRDLIGSDVIGSLVGDAIEPGDGEPITLIDAANGLPLATYRGAGAGVAARAAAAAAEGHHAWVRLTAATRGRLLWALGAEVRTAAPALAEAEAIIAGKPIRDARAEVARVAEMFEYWAGWADKIHGETIPAPTSHHVDTRREPHGVALILTPWNAPIFTAGWNAAPALACGNAALMKPSELTPLTTLALGRLALKAGLPPGALAVIAGDGRATFAPALAHHEVGCVTFVGSAATGVEIATAAARRLVPCVLELGGKSANIVFADADLRRAVIGAQAAIFAGAGQSCVAGARLLVQRPIHDRLVAALADASHRLRIGAPLDEATEVGPLAHARHFAHVTGMVARAEAAGARRVTRPAPEGPGYFVAPTLLTDVPPAAEIAREEVFGPVLAAMPFDDEDEAVALANGTGYGLAGAVWTADVGRARRMAARVKAGSFWINGYKTIHVSVPFGGFGRSGHGRSSGREAIDAYTRTKAIWTETAADPPVAFGYAPPMG
jgi:acyl-CoA reductase-like NAD-dependent aldehyde dehydrogenase